MNRAAIGRADLIRWADHLDGARLKRLADLGGFEQPPEAKPDGQAQAINASGSDSLATGVPAIAGGLPTKARCELAVVWRETLKPTSDSAEPIAVPPAPERVEPLPDPPPLMPWARLWPFLRVALGCRAERNRIDLKRTVAAAARLQPLRRLPRLTGRRWAVRGQLILDLSPRLYPFWNDFHAIKEQIESLRGVAGLEVLRMDRGPFAQVQPWQGKGWGPPRRYVPPSADTPLLIAGDLGCLGRPGDTGSWLRFGRQLAAHGCRPVALTPCPSRWWDKRLAGLYFPVTLDRAAPVPPVPAGPLPWPADVPDLGIRTRADADSDAGAGLLLTLLSACIAITPPLLRHLRHALPASLADVGSEAAAWQHSAFIGGDFPLLPGDPQEIKALRDAFATTGTPEQRRLAWELILAQQALTEASAAVRMEERALHAAQLRALDPEAEAFFERVGQVLAESRAGGAVEHARKLTAWVDRRASRTHADLWPLSPASVRLWLDAHPEATADGAILPPGLERELLKALRSRNPAAQPRSWRLVQRGEQLEWQPLLEATGELASGSPMAGRLTTALPALMVRQATDAAPWLSLGVASAALPLTESGWQVQTEFERLHIAPVERPPWAQSIATAFGRDQLGLFIGFDDGRGERRAYWCSPGGDHPDWLAPSAAALNMRTRMLQIEQGFFLDEAQFRAFGSEGFFPSGLRDALRLDDDGIRAEITIKGIPVGLRWIWPCAFLMGSPETEEGRYDAETQHEVILTRGLWLAETACTQALWQAVIGENPSGNKGPDLPVENVSWDDVQRFLQRLNEEMADLVGGPAEAGAVPPARPAVGSEPDPAFRWRLPTEAEWEFACRAGTQTAYHFGDSPDPKLANNGRATLAVASLPPNPWGFYEMHGNVWEWCEGWFADYPAGPVIDPVGPTTGEGRVLRGGGRFNVARNLRSAYRIHDGPRYRYGSGGFRLALGPELRPVQPRSLDEAQRNPGHGANEAT